MAASERPTKKDPGLGDRDRRFLERHPDLEGDELHDFLRAMLRPRLSPYYSVPGAIDIVPPATPTSLLHRIRQDVIQILFGTTRLELQPAAGCGAAERLPRQVSLPESWLGRPLTLITEKLEFADTGRPTCWLIYPEEAGVTLRLRLFFEAHEDVVQTSLAHELLISDEDVSALVAMEIIEILP
jgi:hypothetical protein